MMGRWKNKDITAVPFELGKTRVLNIGQSPYSETIANGLLLALDDYIVVVDWLRFRYMYKTKFMICCGVDEFDMPAVFHRIMLIFTSNLNHYFVTKLWKTVYCDKTNHSFVVEETSTLQVVNVQDLFCPEPMELHQSYESTAWHIVPRYHLM